MPGLERALPASYYLSPEAFARERERVLYREWFCAGRADQVRRPGSLMVLDVAGESVLLLRTRAGELRAHYNVCRHHGSQVVPTLPAAPGASPPSARKVGSLRCSYHTPGYVHLAGLAYQAWADLEREAGERLVVRTGGLDLFPPGAAIPADAYLASLDACGVPHRWLDAAEVQRRWPAFRLEPGTGGLWQADAGIVPAARGPSCSSAWPSTTAPPCWTRPR